MRNERWHQNPHDSEDQVWGTLLLSTFTIAGDKCVSRCLRGDRWRDIPEGLANVKTVDYPNMIFVRPRPIPPEYDI